MNKTKLCCFTVNTTHALIISNNFISKNLEGIKVIYIDESENELKLKNIVNRFYKNIKNKVFWSKWLNEKVINDYEKENIVYVIHGTERFVENINKFLNTNNFNGFVINCYDVYDIKEKISNIIEKHDYYINTTGAVGKDFEINSYFTKTGISRKNIAM